MEMPKKGVRVRLSPDRTITVTAALMDNMVRVRRRCSTRCSECGLPVWNDDGPECGCPDGLCMLVLDGCGFFFDEKMGWR